MEESTTTAVEAVHGLPAAPRPEKASEADDARVKLRQLAERLAAAPGWAAMAEYLRLRRSLMR